MSHMELTHDHVVKGFIFTCVVSLFEFSFMTLWDSHRKIYFNFYVLYCRTSIKEWGSHTLYKRMNAIVHANVSTEHV